MKKSLFCLICALCFITFSADAEVVATGEPAPEIPAKEWLDTKTHTIAEFKNKKAVVLFIWNLDHNGLAAVQGMNKLAELFPAKDVVCLGIANAATLETLKFPGVKKLPFPVCADKERKTAKLYLRSYDTLPLAVVIDRTGRVNWRGSIRQVPVTVKRLLAGKFDLKEQIRAEKFSSALKKAVRSRDFAKADRLIRAEWARTPKNLDLLSMLLVVNFRHLKKADEAFKLIEEAHKKVPKHPRVAELELQLIINTGRTDTHLAKFCKQAIADHGHDPVIMKKFAARASELKAKEFDINVVHAFMQSGWRNGKFAKKADKVDYALDYAKLLHNFCRPELAYKLALWAKQNSDDPDKQGVSGAVVYYQKIIQNSSKLAL